MTERDRLDFDGPANFRDLGGYRTRGGGTVRAGRVFRSDSLSFLSDADLIRLRDDLGIRTVIDLRAPHEVQEHGHGPLAEHVRRLHLPIVDQTRDSPPPRLRIRRTQQFQTLDQIYAFMLREYTARFGKVLQAIADAESHPVVFHCAAGKDRTGLTAALVLSICDVPEEVIASDFAVTETRMPTIIARHTARAELGDLAAEVAGQQYGAPSSTMTTVLERMRADYGSVLAYVESAGLTADAIGELRELLVEPG